MTAIVEKLMTDIEAIFQPPKDGKKDCFGTACFQANSEKCKSCNQGVACQAEFVENYADIMTEFSNEINDLAETLEKKTETIEVTEEIIEPEVVVEEDPVIEVEIKRSEPEEPEISISSLFDSFIASATK